MPATMLKLNREQRALLADKLSDLANLAAGALVFGQFLADRRFSPIIAVFGVVGWILSFVFVLILKVRAR
jgi:hypothetical protein